MTMHRRPLGRGRTLAAFSALFTIVGPILPWWQVGGTPGIPMESGNGLPGVGIVIFLVGIATLALLALPYAAGDRPVGLDRWLSFALLAGAGWIAFVWRLIELAMLEAFQFTEPIQIFTHSPGIWVTGIGLAMLARAAWTMSREPAYR